MTPDFVKDAPVKTGEPALGAGLKVGSSINGFSKAAADVLPFSKELPNSAFEIHVGSIPAGGVPPAKFNQDPFIPHQLLLRHPV